MKKIYWKPAFGMLLFALAAPAFAADDVLPPGLTTLSKNILGVFTGPFVKTILVIAVCGCAIGYAYNKDNEKAKKNLIAIGVAVAILACASFIVGTIFNSAKTEMAF